ncbi:MAG: helix-turn-helix domain-containing protein [Polaromonas sp.]|uniref:helix-turn-helix domain-containing protein n=1 Tax=Polaromonas sp. TaxID=1869339 RepID=UPI0025D1E7B2|nr:helix-turn-helix domain-containing protein [Polaromonas sp.]MBI2725375.1 helix-turn-helix domain-containing protein [Polaromonas sp.]
MERSAPIRSICRSIAVLQAINRAGSLTLQEISRNADIPYPTAFRIIQTLVHEGLVECEPHRKRYRATALTQSLSLGFRDSGKLVEHSHSPIVAMTKKIGWPMSLTTRAGQTMMVRDSTHLLTSLTFNNYYPGYTLPILGCSSGHVYLAYCDDEERTSILNGIKTLGDESPMLKLFESGSLRTVIRENGYATIDRNRNNANPGKTSSIAVPVFENGHIAGALTLIFFSSAMAPTEAVARYMDDLKETARKIGMAVSDPDFDPHAELIEEESPEPELQPEAFAEAD